MQDLTICSAGKLGFLECFRGHAADVQAKEQIVVDARYCAAIMPVAAAE